MYEGRDGGFFLINIFENCNVTKKTYLWTKKNDLGSSAIIFHLYKIGENFYVGTSKFCSFDHFIFLYFFMFIHENYLWDLEMWRFILERKISNNKLTNTPSWYKYLGIQI